MTTPINSIDGGKMDSRKINRCNNAFSFIEPNIIFVAAKGEQTTEQAELSREICNELTSLIEGKVNYLIDLNDCGKNSPEAREIWQQMAASDKTHKAATFGLNPVARVIASFVIGVYRKKNMRFFPGREEAILWLLDN